MSMTSLEQAVVDAALREGLIAQAAVGQALARRDASTAAGRPAELLALLASALPPATVERLRAIHAAAQAADLRATLERPPAPSTVGGATPRSSPAVVGVGSRVGPYRLEAELGRGGMGIVFLALHEALERRVALKLSLRAADGDPRFQREVLALGRLKHPAIVDVHEAGYDAAGRPWLAMALVDGESLAAKVVRDGPLDGPSVARVGAALARGLEHAHAAGILHRDLKPQNVLIDRQGAPRLIDFGLATDASARERLTVTGEVMGTPAYMSPEQASGERSAVGPASDVYGLGAVLYFALTGEPPFEGASVMNVLAAVLRAAPQAPSRLVAGVDGELEGIILRCLAKGPAERYATGGELAEALERWRPLEPSRARGRGALLAAGAVSALAVALAAGSLLTRPGPDPVTTTTAVVAPGLPPPPPVATIAPPASSAAATTRIVIDAQTFASVPFLEVREPWLAELTDGGVRLRAGVPIRPRPGLVLSIERKAPGPVSIRTRLRIEVLEPPRRIGVTWSGEDPGAPVIVAGVVPEWIPAPGGHGRVLAIQPGIAYSITHDHLIGPVAGTSVPMGEGPLVIDVELRLEESPPRAVATFGTPIDQTLVQPLDAPPGRRAWVGLFPDPAQRLQATTPLPFAGEGRGAKMFAPARSTVVVERLSVEAASVVVVSGSWRPDVGQAGRDLLVPGRRRAALDALAASAASGGASSPGDEEEPETGGEETAERPARAADPLKGEPGRQDDIRWARAVGLAAGGDGPAATALLEAMATSPDASVRERFWEHVNADRFALDGAARALVSEQARLHGHDHWGIPPDGLDVAQRMLHGAGLPRRLTARWGIACTWLDDPRGRAPVTADAVALAVLAGDLEGALTRAPARPADAAPSLRAWYGLAAYRLRRFDAARAWWKDLDPAHVAAPADGWLRDLAPPLFDR